MQKVYTFHYDQENDPVEIVFTTIQPDSEAANIAFVEEYLRVDSMIDETPDTPTDEDIKHAHNKAMKSLHSVLPIPQPISPTFYKAQKMDEMILCSDADPIRNITRGKTFISDGFDVDHILQQFSKQATAQRRGDAENDPSMKQLIPYVILKKGDTVFLYERLSGSGEKRLVGSSSVGIGGHMNLIADSSEGLLHNICVEASREIMEELHVSHEIDLSDAAIYILNDESDEVGKVHLGAVMVVDVDPAVEITVQETEQLRGGFVAFTDIDRALLENWSKIALENLNLLPSTV